VSRDNYFKVVDHESTCPYVAAERQLALALLNDAVRPDGRLRFPTLSDVHRCLINVHGFCMRRRNREGVLPGGWHLFYFRYHVLVRIKTTGTPIRPRPHMTVSLAVGADGKIGFGWDDELQKFSLSADKLPKAFSRAVQWDWRLWRYRDQAAEADEAWAQAVHFDFPEGFQAANAATIHLP